MLHSFFEKMCYVAFVLCFCVVCCIRSLKRFKKEEAYLLLTYIVRFLFSFIFIHVFSKDVPHCGTQVHGT